MVRPTGDESRQVPIAEVKPDSWGHTISQDLQKDDTVTLTKSQFQQILEAIGQAHGVNGSEKIYPCHENEDQLHAKSVSENNCIDSSPKKNMYNNVSTCVPSSEESSNKLHVPCPLDVVISCPTSLSWSAPQTDLSPSKLSPLSKVEQKRLQWEKERAEMIDWNPWGKPGAGAPAKKTQIVAPITPRANNQLLMVQTSAAMPYTSSVPAGISSCLPSPNVYRNLPNALEHNNFLPNKNFTNYSCVAQPIKPVPPVFKSSIAFGNDVGESGTSEQYKRHQWLREMDYQREEHRRYQEQLHMSQVSDPSWNNHLKEDIESISVSVDGSVLPGATELSKRTYMRGQGFQLDPVSAALAEERRQKAQEYQQAIRLQMEEKKRRLQAERERKKREEEAEEKRLEAERARIQAEYEEEQKRIKQKAEIEEKKHQALVTAVQQAQAQAEMEKKSRKIQKLLPLSHENQESNISSDQKDGNNDVLSLTNNLDSNLVISTNANDSKENISTCSLKSSNSPLKNEPEPKHDTDCKKELGVQTVPVSDSEKSSVYVVDRVLTPSIFRVRAKAGHRRDFGTQTDIHYGKYSVDDAESTESNSSSFHSPVAKRVIRVQHNKPYKAQRRPQCSDGLTVNDRPKWGVNQPSKSYVRMTERDPHFTKRKRMQELRKQHWARELAAQKANQTSRRSTVTSYPNLCSRRAASSSDCTLGYSSSDFETRSYRPFRSNSTPRYHQPSAFRSECGSAETIAYFSYSPSHNSRLPRSLLHRRESQSSDNLPSIIGGSEPSPSRRIDSFPLPSCGGASLPPMRRKWHSQETFYPVTNCHTFSPPHVPGVYPRTLGESFHYELIPPHPPQRRKWSDQESFDLESVVRSRVAEGSRASSAESSEKSEAASASSAGSSRGKSANQNPLVCPEVVTGRPTPRQDRILQNLSSLRQGLLKKQKELENLIRRPPPYLS
ncbi:uncharacterized protein LOC118188176 isoform X2 [Stegodyphus dumicola]|uniref:uncharacterized protein LOC118188176 isoform X2 n=1 Tax=Stegodyphus dumicola TaxID=202533 RepID=UPI0015AED61E|nr:uncharacterized protein LOC118188176 isoform X2 [Stegodyphus dumicola]